MIHEEGLEGFVIITIYVIIPNIIEAKEVKV